MEHNLWEALCSSALFSLCPVQGLLGTDQSTLLVSMGLWLWRKGETKPDFSVCVAHKPCHSDLAAAESWHVLPCLSPKKGHVPSPRSVLPLFIFCSNLTPVLYLKNRSGSFPPVYNVFISLRSSSFLSDLGLLNPGRGGEEEGGSESQRGLVSLSAISTGLRKEESRSTTSLFRGT